MAIITSFNAAMLYRALFALFCVAVGSWLWIRSVLWSPHLRTEGPAPFPSSSGHPPSRLSGSAHHGVADVLFPVPPAAWDISWLRENHLMLQSLFHCIERSDCRENQTKVVFLASVQFLLELGGHTSGEQIWARSVTQALRNMGYTFLYTSSLDQTIQLYQMFPDLVKAILVDDADLCFGDSACSLSAENPTGIPPWKVFTFAFWPNEANPLGPHWTLAPENYELLGVGHNTYVGYSIEDACRKQPFIPHSKRENEAYVLAKLLSFFSAERDGAWTPKIFDAATDATGIKYLIGAINDTLKGEWPAAELPSNHVDFGEINQTTFLDKLSRSRVLIGMGNPATSPTPYDALCLGVPFINPIQRWDEENPSDRSQWLTQHPVMERLDPPYNYNVFRGDVDGFVQAIKDAIAHPIESYVLEPMRMSSVEKRLAAILEKDWKSEAASRMS